MSDPPARAPLGAWWAIKRLTKAGARGGSGGGHGRGGSSYWTTFSGVAPSSMRVTTPSRSSSRRCASIAHRSRGAHALRDHPSHPRRDTQVSSTTRSSPASMRQAPSARATRTTYSRNNGRRPGPRQVPAKSADPLSLCGDACARRSVRVATTSSLRRTNRDSPCRRAPEWQDRPYAWQAGY